MDKLSVTCWQFVPLFYQGHWKYFSSAALLCLTTLLLFSARIVFVPNAFANPKEINISIRIALDTCEFQSEFLLKF